MPLDLEAFFDHDLEARITAHLMQNQQLQSVSAVVQFELLEASDGLRDWYVVFERGACKVHHGVSETLDVTLRGHALDFVDLLEGFADARAALTDGRLEIEGDLGLAVRLLPLFFNDERPQDQKS